MASITSSSSSLINTIVQLQRLPEVVNASHRNSTPSSAADSESRFNPLLLKCRHITSIERRIEIIRLETQSRLTEPVFNSLMSAHLPRVAEKGRHPDLLQEKLSLWNLSNAKYKSISAITLFYIFKEQVYRMVNSIHRFICIPSSYAETLEEFYDVSAIMNFGYIFQTFLPELQIEILMQMHRLTLEELTKLLDSDTEETLEVDSDDTIIPNNTSNFDSIAAMTATNDAITKALRDQVYQLTHLSTPTTSRIGEPKKGRQRRSRATSSSASSSSASSRSRRPTMETNAFYPQIASFNEMAKMFFGNRLTRKQQQQEPACEDNVPEKEVAGKSSENNNGNKQRKRKLTSSSTGSRKSPKPAKKQRQPRAKTTRKPKATKASTAAAAAAAAAAAKGLENNATN